MKRTSLVFVLLVVLGSAGSTLADGASGWRVNFFGYGPVKVGMTVREAADALRMPLDGQSEPGCYYVTPRGLSGVAFMIIDDKVTRIDVDSVDILTDAGAGIGQSMEKIRNRYTGRVVVEPHAYTGPEGKYLTVRSPDGLHDVRFEWDNESNRVTRYYAGRHDAIQFIEGCL